jgi:hypothetical protein
VTATLAEFAIGEKPTCSTKERKKINYESRVISTVKYFAPWVVSSRLLGRRRGRKHLHVAVSVAPEVDRAAAEIADASRAAGLVQKFRICVLPALTLPHGQFNR